VHPVEGEAVGLDIYRLNVGNGQLMDADDVTLTADRIVRNPILYSNVFTVKTERGVDTHTGYLVYNRFDSNYQNELTSLFQRDFKGKVENLILDLRYNRSGSAANALFVANLLVPEAARGKTFATYKYRDGVAAPNNNVPTAFAPDATNGLGLSTIYILTSKFTAGASELLINALRGIEPDIIRLVVIGDTTEGMSMGMTIEECEPPGSDYHYTMGILSFRPYNDKGEWNYDAGFTPNGGGLITEWDNVKLVRPDWNLSISEDTLKIRDDTEQDPLLIRAFDYILGVQLPNQPVGLGDASNRSGYPRDFSVRARMTMQ
jgi:C-terminal processing protease CtpA/Prc